MGFYKDVLQELEREKDYSFHKMKPIGQFFNWAWCLGVQLFIQTQIGVKRLYKKDIRLCNTCYHIEEVAPWPEVDVITGWLYHTCAGDN